MPQNYDSTNVGVPYVRAHKVEIFYPVTNRYPQAIIGQQLAVKMADGTVRPLEELTPLTVTFDMAIDGATPIPLVDPTSGAPLGMDTTLQQVMLGILAVVRSEQVKAG